jgi:hypothetical protein
MSVTLPIIAYIQLNGVEYYGKVVKAGCRNHHSMSEYVGKRVIDVSKEPSDDSWTHWYLFESEMPLPNFYDSTFVHSLDYASWIDVDRDDCETPGQLFRRRAYISKMGQWKMIITQSGGRDI